MEKENKPRSLQGGRILFLRGPTGTGKSAVIHALANDMNFHIASYESAQDENEYYTPEHEALGMRRKYIPVLNNFKNYVNKCKTYLSFEADMHYPPRTRQLLLLEEWPDLSNLRTRNEFHEFLIEGYFDDLDAKFPMVFIQSDSYIRHNSDHFDKNLSKLTEVPSKIIFPEKIRMNKDRFTEIWFNPIPKENIRLGLGRTRKLLANHYPNELMGIIDDIIKMLTDSIAEESHGDIRNSINQFQWVWQTIRQTIAETPEDDRISKIAELIQETDKGGTKDSPNLLKIVQSILSGKKNKSSEEITSNIPCDPATLHRYLWTNFPRYFQDQEGAIDNQQMQDIKSGLRSLSYGDYLMGSTPYTEKQSIEPSAIDIAIRAFLNRKSVPPKKHIALLIYPFQILLTADSLSVSDIYCTIVPTSLLIRIDANFAGSAKSFFAKSQSSNFCLIVIRNSCDVINDELVQSSTIMKIKKTPPKKLVAPISPIKNLIQRLTECQDHEIPSIIASQQEWSYPRGDLFHWIGVLNRFDTILETTCQTYKLKKLQTQEFTPEERSILLAVLKFSRILLENCTNRNLYSSYEHLNDLLNTSDLDLLETLLRLILRPAQRLSNQRAMRTNFSISHDRILTLGHSWGTKDYDLEMKDLAYDNVIIPEELKSLTYQFYRHLTPAEAAGTAGDKKADSSIAASSTPTPKQKTKDSSNSNTVAKNGEGITIISANNIHELGTSVIDILKNVVEEYDVPEEFHFALLNRIRIVMGISSKEKRRQLLIIRILAIAIMAHVVPEHIAQTKLFLYEPDIVANLAELVHPEQKNTPERKVPFEIQTVAFYALDGISRYRSKLGEVLTAINASANHGVLLYVMRRVVADLENENPTSPQEYLDALFAFIQYIIQTQQGGTMVISAGIVPTLLKLLTNKKASQLKARNVAKAVSLLDSLVYSFSTSFTTFCNANGVNILVERIKDEVTFDVQFATQIQGDQMEDVTIASRSTSHPSTSKEDEPILPYERSSLLKSMFKFILHMMQTSGTADGLRNLIETSLPESLNRVLDHPIFGSSIYALAIHLMATFIHNEPTSLPIMQEARLPQTFLRSITSEIPASVDVIQQIPNAFGAICLNNSGLELFNQTKPNPIVKFFSIFTSTEHVRVIQDGDIASHLGNSIDELMRHHPTLKPTALEAIMDTLKRIIEIGQGAVIPINDDNNRLHVAPATSEQAGSTSKPTGSDTIDVNMTDLDAAKPEEKKENFVVALIENAVKFLDGLFQNSSHCRDFLKQNGLDVIIQFYSLPTLPYDFGNTPASYALSNSMRLIAETDSKAFVKSVISSLNTALKEAQDFLDTESKESRIVEYIDLEANKSMNTITESKAEKVQEANKTFRSLVTLYGFVGLLSDIYYTPGFSHSKSSPSVIEAFVADKEILPALGKLHRVCVWENVLLKSAVPKSWYSSPSKLRKSSSLTPGESSLFVTSFDDGEKDNTDPNEPPVDPTNRQVKNTKSLKFLVSQIPSCLTPLFQGLTKMLFSRKAPDANQKKQAFKVSDAIAQVLSDHLTWKRYSLDSGSDSSHNYSYLSIMLGLLSLLFLDGKVHNVLQQQSIFYLIPIKFIFILLSQERNQMALQTMLVVSFDRVGGLECVLALLRQFWEEAQGIHALAECTTETDDGSKEKLARIHSCLEITLNFFQFIASSKLLHESPHTSTLTSKERDRTNSDFFDPFEFLVNIRAKIFPVINELWQSPYLLKAPPNIVKSVVQNLVQILKGEGEVNQRPEGSTNSSTTPYVFGRNIVPDEERIQQLIDMGFPRSAAETALLRCNNHADTAAEYLVTHPEMVAEAVLHASAEASQAAENTNDTTANDTPQEAPPPESQADPTTQEQTGSSSSTEDDNISNDDESVLEQALALSMQGNPFDNSGAPVPMEMDPVAKKMEKGKGKEISIIDQFKILQEEVKETAAPRALELLNQTEDVIFEVRDLFVLLSKDKFANTMELVFKSIEDISSELSQSDSQRTKVLGSRLRLLALLLNESSIQTNISSIPLDIIPVVLQLIRGEAALSSESQLSSWLAAALLVIEAFISLADEPTLIPLDTKPEDSKEEDEDIVMSSVTVTDEQRSSLLSYALALISTRQFGKDVRHALLRILVRLTRRHADAVEFVKRNGLSVLFNLYKTKAYDFHRQQVFIIMILRHIIEESQVLESIMDREIKNWFTHPRPRVVDINTYLRNNSQFALRDPQVFVQSTKNVCKLTKYDSSGRNYQITVIRPDAEETNTANQKQDVPISAEEMADVTPSTSASAEKGKKLTHISQIPENPVQFLANELISIREQSSSGVTANKELEPERVTNIEEISSATIFNTSSNPLIDFKPEDNLDYLSRCFLLQCFTELLLSYPSCKIDVINLCRRRNSTGPNTTSKHRIALIDYLLDDLLPYGCITQTNDIEMRKRHGQSKLTVAFFVALCGYQTESEDKKLNPEIFQVRKFVLDCISRSFHAAIASTEPLETKYGRLLGLAELCYELLTTRGVSNNNINKVIDEGSNSIAKIMLDRKFVEILTTALAELDLNYPSAKNLINSLLKPLECLTKVATKMGRTAESLKDGKSEPPRRDSISSGSTSSSEELTTEAMDTPDLYENSVLGTLEGRVSQDNNQEETLDTSEEEEEPYEDDEYEEESASDLSDLSNEEDSDDDDNDDDNMDVEIVVRQPPISHASEMSDDEDDDPDFEVNQSQEHRISEDLNEEETDDVDDEDDDDVDHHDESQGITWNNVNESVMLDNGDIEEVIQNDESRRPRHSRHDRFGQDDDGAMLVDEDEDDDEDLDEEDEDEEEDDVGENDVVLDGGDAIDDGYEDRLSINFGWNNHSTLFVNEDDIGAPVVRPGRALFSFGNRRHRGLPGRRAILEVPPDSLDYLWGDTSEQGRHDYLGADSDLPGLGRGRPLTNTIDEVSSHPLLVNRAPALPPVPGADPSRSRSSRNGPLGDWTQSIEELIGGGAVQLLEQLLNRGRTLGVPSTYRLELNPNSTGVVSGIDVDRMFPPRPIVTAQETNLPSLPGDPISAVQEFTPAPTSQRWFDEARMMYGTAVAEKSTKLVNHIANALIPQALVEEKKRKAREEKEKEERRIRDEQEKQKEEARKKEEEKAKAEEEQAGGSLSVNENQTTQEQTSHVIETDIVIEDAPPIEERVPELDSTTAMEEEPSLIITHSVEPPIADLSSRTAMEEETTVTPMEAEPSPTPENLPNVTTSNLDIESNEQIPAVEFTATLDVAMIPEQQNTETTPEAGSSDILMATESVSVVVASEAGEGASDPSNVPPPAPPPEERTTVMVNGVPVDITNTGIDPTFLEALPDDLRQEVLNEHLPRNRPRPAAPGSAQISPEFLQALPDELRDEVLQQQQDLQRERQERDRPTGAAPAEMDNATFFATLDPQLRQTVLMEQDDLILQSLPPAIVAEAQALRRANRRYTSAVRSRTLANAVPTHIPKKPTLQRDAMKLVDVDGLATLVRLLFLPQALGKNLLHKLLLNLCENSKTRAELVAMLLSILQDGSADVVAVDKSFAQMTLRNKGTPKGAKKGKANSANMLSQIAQTAGENVPNLIAQRCLEALTYIITYNEASVNYFLSEHEQVIGIKRSNSKKGKEKQAKVITSKYPVVILLSLLDKQVFVKNTTLMDQLMHLLSFVLRPLSSLAKLESSKTLSTSAEPSAQSNSLNAQLNATSDSPAEVSSNAPQSSVPETIPSEQNDSDITNNQPANNTHTAQSTESSHNLNNSTDNSGNNDTNTNSSQPPQPPNEQTNSSANENSTTAAGPSTSRPQPEALTLKPPVIPDHCLRLVVNVLTAGECTSNTFKYTLNVIQYLSTLSGAREVITSELVEKAQSLGNDILEDLDELARVLDQATSGVEVQGVTLSNFSPTSSKQAKLLRVLKTIDYMYSRKQTQQSTPTSNTRVEVSLAPTVDPEQADTATPRTKVVAISSGSKLTEDEEKVMNIYDSLKFTELWKKLGRCLTTIHEKADMIHVATVLLPLIETLMVVCKYVAIGTSSAQPGESSATDNMEELFLTFTEDHRKILNTMVRNNPSLMSGSFSLLVHNPKILEFDNKRNYFTQQLHKRPSTREHYGNLQLNVRRQYVFEDSFQYLQRRTGDEIKYGKLSVRFYEEEGVDAGGVTREWFQVLARQMFNENYALFKTSAADRLTYQPNRASFVNPEHLLFFKFVGRVIGKAIYDGRLLDAYFTRSFYKHILGKPVDYRDVEAIDLEYYNSLVWILENDISQMDDLTFTVEDNDFGMTKQVELKPGGANTRVTEENKREYVKLVTEQKLTLAIKEQIANFLAGFHEVIPAHLISIFNEQELELLISGMPDIDIDDWKNNTEYQNYTSSSPQIQWFWRAVRSFDQEERAKLLQFVTGTSKVPLEGFSALQGVHGVQKFQIHKDFASPDRLPSAHTCFNQLDIPEYDNYEQLRAQVLLAISEGTTGFGIAVIKKTAKVSGSSNGFRSVLLRKKRRDSVLENSSGGKNVGSKTGNTTESNSIDMEEECLIEKTSFDYSKNSALARGDSNQTPTGLKVKTKKVLDKPLGKINFSLNDDEDDVFLDALLELPPSLKNLVNISVCKFFALNIELDKVLFSKINGFGEASTSLKFAGIIRAIFISESSLAQASKKAKEAKILVNINLKKLSECLDRTVMLKEILIAVVEFEQVNYADLVTAKWSILIRKDAMHVARSDVNKKLWDVKDIYKALLYTLPMGTNIHDIWDYVASVSEKTCVIDYYLVFYVRARCAAVCFDFAKSLDVVIKTMSVLKEANLYWSCLAIHFWLCYVSGKKNKTFLDFNKSRLATIYAKCSASVARPVSFDDSSFPPPSIRNVVLNTGFSSEIKFTPLVSLKLNDRFATFECSLTSLIKCVDKLAKRLDTPGSMVSQLSPGCQLLVISSLQNQEADIVMSENSGVITSGKTVVEAVVYDPSIVLKIEETLNNFSITVISLLAKMDNAGSIWNVATCNIREINNPVKQSDIIHWYRKMNNLISIFDDVCVFTFGVDSGYLDLGIAIIINSSLAHHVCKIFSVKLFFKNKFSVSILGLYADASLVVQFFQTGDINSFIAKAVNEFSFIIFGGDFNEDKSHKCASFRKCFDLGLVNSLARSSFAKTLIWCNSRGVAKMIDYMFISSNLVNVIMGHNVASVKDYFNTDHIAISVSVGLDGLLNVQLFLLCKQTNKDYWKFDIISVNKKKWCKFRDITAANAAMFSNAFVAAERFSDLNVMWDIVYYDNVFTKVSFRLYKLELLVSRLVKAFHLVSSKDFASLLGTWDRLDSNGTAEKFYYSSKLLEFKCAEESHIKQTITNRIESFELDKSYTIKNMLEHSFYKIVLDHLVVDDELVLKPDLVKVVPNIFDDWICQYQPLNYVFNSVFSDVMCLIGSDKLFAVVSNLSDEKAAVLDMLLVFLNLCLTCKSVPGSWKEAWEGVFINTYFIALIETAHKILSKILSDRIFSACSTYDVLYRDNFSVLKDIIMQSPIFAISSVVEDALEKN
ncbi:hypothetical protein G9A89_012136 [Geosiphon pyriformis]|nr:hypothetical protein G9A89_012136 [Geosiphon pyriformis]